MCPLERSLESAAARLTAGELDRAVETSRRAADVALALGDPKLELSALLLLATTLIHSHFGRDQEAKGLLSRALQLAGDLDDLESLADVEREMGFVFAMEGSGALAEPVLTRSVDHAVAADVGIRAAKAETYLGMCLSDRCNYERAVAVLNSAIARLPLQGSWDGRGAEGMLARAVERSGDPARGASIAEIGIEHVRRGGSSGVLPWPMLVLANCALDMGDRDTAANRFAEALTLATEIGDPCYQALGLRGLGLLSAPNDRDAALQLLVRAVSYCRRYRDVYPWARALILTDLVELQRGADDRVLEEAYELAVLGPIPDLAERLTPYRRRPEVSPNSSSTQTDLQTVVP